jgi:uncharacterized damage-inducible protein DinB
MPQEYDSTGSPRLDITPHWRQVQEHLLQIVDLLPEDKLNWTPAPALWNSKGILIHVSNARDNWLHGAIEDGEGYANIWTTARTKDDLKREMQRSFERLLRFLGNQAQLDGTYPDEFDGKKFMNSGHWIAFHLLEHDIHHRAELLQRLALLEIDHGIDI